jgi:protein ImuB
VIVAQEAGAMRLAAVDGKARSLGLDAGLTLADARARVPDIIVHHEEPDKDLALLAQIAEWCERYTPFVVEEPPDGLVLEIAGSAHLFGGEKALFDDISTRLSSLGFSLCVAIAGTPYCAKAIARFGLGGIVVEGGEKEAAGSLPIAALQSEAETTLALKRAGLKTVSDVAARPRKLFSARFGSEFVARLSGILGETIRPLSPRRPPPDFTCQMHFADPIGLIDDIEAAVVSLSSRLCRHLEEKARGGRVFEACFFRADGVMRRIDALSGRPLHDADALKDLFMARLDALADPLDPGFGFDAIRLSVLRSEDQSPDQRHLANEEADKAAIVELVDRLTARFGADCVERFVPLQSHVPERAVRRHAAIDDTVKDAGPWPILRNGDPPMRPILLFSPPQPVETVAEVPDGPPLRFRWRRVLHDIVRMEGPERIAPEWWRNGSETLSRDYYRVEDTQGYRFWLFRHGVYGRETGHTQWYIHGLFA